MFDLREIEAPNKIPAITAVALVKVDQLAAALRMRELLTARTSHLIHGGIYSRTLKLDANSWLVGVMVKIPTTLVISGDVVMYVNGEARELNGYNVFAASAHRKQALYARTVTTMTMSFPTDAKTVEEAEAQFTDEVDLLCSRLSDAENQTNITGE